MHHQETGGCPNIQCPSFIFRQFLYLHKLWNLISSSLSDLGMVTGSFSHIVPMKRTQSGEKIVFLQQYNDGNVTHQIHCLCSLMDRWNIINLIITCSGVLDHRQRVVCLKEVKFYRTIQAPRFQSVNFINSFQFSLVQASPLCSVTMWMLTSWKCTRSIISMIYWS